MEFTLTGLRVLREVAERGSFTAAADALGYTQSAVSRQVAALEQAAGSRLFDRHSGGVRPTSAGHTLLRHGLVALDALASAERELRGTTDDVGRVRLGFFPSAGAVLVARSLAAVRREHPHLRITTREASTPSLLRALRTGALDLALVSSRPPHRAPDTDDPPLQVEPLLEDRLALAVPETSRLAGSPGVTVDQLAGQTWIGSPAGIDEPVLGIWPGLAGRPRIRHATRDWMTKLSLVAAGAGITTVPSTLRSALPPGVRLVAVDGVPEERRRISVVRLPGPATASADAVVHELRRQAAELAE
ncbi:LysR family transcriptional regulator [Rhodococcus sp. D2-41]|uniref:LysR family transcriptional regulator n=1 Tax=Speluncibacter jeojiensis TaxID=2710754 RepID=UPI00240FBFAC|nr:LysR substrate-binding domain-containing protein [Rhodococcus sp. D2-41]MDG3010783.1 LysR family transcriptional regulator [Rhodococcus sp. D2-41]